jgi:hypothetical protein
LSTELNAVWASSSVLKPSPHMTAAPINPCKSSLPSSEENLSKAALMSALLDSSSAGVVLRQIFPSSQM